jgi:hypothetical protein
MFVPDFDSDPTQQQHLDCYQHTFFLFTVRSLLAAINPTRSITNKQHRCQKTGYYLLTDSITVVVVVVVVVMVLN